MAQTTVFKGTARNVVTLADDGSRLFIYHSTVIVRKYTDGRVVLDSGGYHTNTTKNAMNQAAYQYGMGFSVSQRKGDWFVRWGEQEISFTDGMTLHTDATRRAAERKALDEITFTKIAHDSNGNPRYVCHFLHLVAPKESHLDLDNKYRAAVIRAHRIGGRKYHCKAYGGGIVFQSYALDDTRRAILQSLKD